MHMHFLNMVRWLVFWDKFWILEWHVLWNGGSKLLSCYKKCILAGTSRLRRIRGGGRGAWCATDFLFSHLKHCRQVYVLYFVVTQASKSVLVLLLKAAIARCGSSTFHILPPQSEECSNFSHAVLLYECGRSGPGDCNQMAGTSGEGFFCTVSWKQLFILR